MWMEEMITIGKCENGFMVQCRCKIKPEKKKDAKELCCCYPGSTEKRYIAKDTTELASLVDKLMPMLEEEYDSEKAFDSAFKEATSGS